MTIQSFLDKAVKELQAAGIATARLDVLVLLEDELGTDRAQLLAHLDRALTADQITKLNNFITRRATHEPLAYIRGRAAFYGRTFMVTPDVLVPRPETEMVIACLLSIASALPQNLHIVDVGTGSGCIGITAKLELPDSLVTLLDIDPTTLAVARHNAQNLRAEVQTHESDLLANAQDPFDVLLANLPYVPQDYPINQAASREPALALFSGQDGLDHYRRFWPQVAVLPANTGQRHAIVESLPEQHDAMAVLAQEAGYSLADTLDFVQHFVRVAD